MTSQRGDDVEKQHDVEPTADEDAETVGSMSDDDDMSMDRAFDDMAIEESLRSVRPGEIVSGTVVEVRGDEVVVHVGGKYEGVIPLIEFQGIGKICLIF